MKKAAYAYAQGTTVPVAKTKMEIDVLLEKMGATQVIIGQDGIRAMAVVCFKMNRCPVRMEVPLPRLEDFSEKEDRRCVDGPRKLSPDQQKRGHEAACRELWRAFLLRLKAKMEWIARGQTTLEAEFMSEIVMKDGRTVGEEFLPRLDAIMGDTPKMLMMG